jgi:glycine hydroxymethyltransferase
MENLKRVDSEIYDLMSKETKRQQENIELIASENLVSRAVLEAQGSILTNKYAEGYPAKRYYGGCEVVDEIETLAIERVKRIFGAKFANVQVHSGSQANFAVFFALLKPGDTVLGLDLSCGGHLTHGSTASVSGKWFDTISYKTDENGFIQYDELEKLANKYKPKLIISGGSAYSRVWDWQRIGSIAKKVDAYHMSDMAHYAGLIAAGIYPSPVGFADIITATTHKTLRGPRGGFVLTDDEEIAKKINYAVFPGFQGGPLMHVIAAKAVAFGEALKPEFKVYQKQVVANAKKLADVLSDNGVAIITGGTDSHMFLADLRPLKVTGKNAQETLEKAGITLNKNGIPNDPQKPFITSGIRIGSPAVTSRGMKEPEMEKIALSAAKVLKNIDSAQIISQVRAEMLALCRQFPIYNDI